LETGKTASWQLPEADARAFYPVRASVGKSANGLPAASQKQAARNASSLDNKHGKA